MLHRLQCCFQKRGLTIESQRILYENKKTIHNSDQTFDTFSFKYPMLDALLTVPPKNDVVWYPVLPLSYGLCVKVFSEAYSTCKMRQKHIIIIFKSPHSQWLDLIL